MEINYVTLLDFSDGSIHVIKLTKEEKELSKKYENIEDFLKILENKYDFKLKNCNYMVSKELKLYRHTKDKKYEGFVYYNKV